VTSRRTVLVASGDRLFAKAAARYLAGWGWNPVGTAFDGLQALAAIGRHRPSAVLVLGELPRLALAALAGQVRRRWPDVPVVVVGGARSGDATALPADAEGEAVLAALTSSPPTVPIVAPEDRPDGVAMLLNLTSRERLVLKLLAEGNSVRDIARHLGVSQHTVRTHMHNLYAKLGAHSRLDVVRFAAQHGLVGGEAGKAGP
jgi:DNA-binding NarL/FixJ family response regulator